MIRSHSLLFRTLVSLVILASTTLGQATEELRPPDPIPDSNIAAGATFDAAAPSGQVRFDEFGVSFAPGKQTEIRGVVIGSPAQFSGVQPRDVILEVNGNPVTSAAEIQQTTIDSLVVQRKDKKVSLNVRARPTSSRLQNRYSTSPHRDLSSQVRRPVYNTPSRSRASTVIRQYRYVPVPVPVAVPSYRVRSLPGSYGYGDYGYRSYRRPSTSFSIGVGGPSRSSIYPGYRGYYGYGRGGYGRSNLGGYGYGRNGVNIRVGGFGISF